MADKVFARYTAQGGEYFPGVPPRDLTKAEFDALAPIQQRDVRAGTIYELASSGGKKTSGDGDGQPNSGSENK